MGGHGHAGSVGPRKKPMHDSDWGPAWPRATPRLGPSRRLGPPQVSVCDVDRVILGLLNNFDTKSAREVRGGRNRGDLSAIQNLRHSDTIWVP